ncbi:uncharacterized protein LOC128551982 [Mercenaria mercenaria]|uniref:uncharacterized protein LOC128551982 n=1 Tax=Mercenaria mercenaria TaxID=6596 RepID=UPI00234F0539|nr:uncharacterized protein LOC128551982 [Mercenaria mercenaria]
MAEAADKMSMRNKSSVDYKKLNETGKGSPAKTGKPITSGASVSTPPAKVKNQTSAVLTSTPAKSPDKAMKTKSAAELEKLELQRKLEQLDERTARLREAKELELLRQQDKEREKVVQELEKSISHSQSQEEEKSDRKKPRVSAASFVSSSALKTSSSGDKDTKKDVELHILRDDLKESTASAFASGTNKNLIVQWESFLLFCLYFKLCFLPASTSTLQLYAQFLSRSFKSVNSIRNYISGVKTMHAMLGYGIEHINIYLLNLSLKGMARLNPRQVKRAEPITIEILLGIYENMDFSVKSNIVYWCLFLFAFFLLARKSNLVPTSKHDITGGRFLALKDREYFDNYILVHINWSKTIQFGEHIQEYILSDSIAKYVDGINYTEVKAYPGANISRLMAKNEKDKSLISKPYTLVHVGPNDIAQNHMTVDMILSNFNALISLIRNYSSTRIIISSILPRPVVVVSTEEKVKEVNKQLKVKCTERRVQFVASFRPFLKFAKPISDLYAVRDGGLHLNYEGTRKLRSVFVNTVAHLPLVKT